MCLLKLSCPSCQSLHVANLCLHFSFKTHVFVTCILIDCSYYWLYPIKNAANGEEEKGGERNPSLSGEDENTLKCTEYP